MAYNTKNILRSGDASPIPIPQFYNPTEDAFNPLTGANLGSGRYGADGVMWGKTAGGVYIPVQVNANGEVLTQLSGSIVATKGVRRTGNLANGVSEIFLERNKETIIHNLIVSYSINHWQFHMLPLWWDGGTWKTVESIGKLGAHIPANAYVVYPGMLNGDFNEMLWEVVSNTDTAKVVRLKNTPLRVRGVKLVLENNMPSDDANMSAVCFYSEVN